MELTGHCMRCGHTFQGPDEGCPECDKDNPHVTSKRNYFVDFVDETENTEENTL